MGEQVASSFGQGHTGPALLLEPGSMGLDQVIQATVEPDDETVLPLPGGLSEGFFLHGLSPFGASSPGRRAAAGALRYLR